MDKMNKMEEPTLKLMSNKFQSVMNVILTFFGDLAFAKYRHSDLDRVKMSNFNVAVYDALTIGISSCANLKEPNISKEQITKFNELFIDPDFFESISGSVNDREKVIKRIEAVRGILL